MPRRTLAILALLVASVAVRLFSVASVRAGEGVHRWAGGPDAWYQARRAALAAEGHRLSPDLWINFPAGESVHWPTSWARVMGAAQAIGGETALALLPVLIGVGTVILLASSARRVLDASATSFAVPWLPGAAFALLPALVYPSVYGALDHHHLEALWAAMALHGGVLGGRRGGFVAALAVVFAWVSVPAWPVIALFAASPPLIARAPNGPLGLLLTTALSLALPVAGYAYFTDPWIRGIEEAKPLITDPTGVLRAVVMSSPGLLILPFMARGWWRRRRDSGMATVLAAAVIAGPVTLLQARFIPYLAFPAVVALTAFLGMRKLRPTLVVALAVLCLLPPARGVVDILSWERDPAPAMEDALLWIARETPPAGDPSHATRRPAWGIVAAWDLGDHIVHLARRPAVADAFHTGAAGRELAAHVLGDTPAEATAIADRIPAPVLVLTNLASGYLQQHRLPGQPAPVDSLYGRLYFRGDTTLGWRRAHASTQGFGFEGAWVPEVQVWVRDSMTTGIPTTHPQE